MRRIVLAAALLLLLDPAAHAGVGEVWAQARWGEDAAALLQGFGARATRLDPPLDFGDSTAPVALPDAEIGGHRFVVYFQMNKAGGGLARIHFERPRHGAVLGIYRDTVAALESEYGAPTEACEIPRRADPGRQVTIVRIWRRDAGTVRAVFRDTTLGASEGCLPGERVGTNPCGLTGQIFVQVSRDAGAGRCG